MMMWQQYSQKKKDMGSGTGGTKGVGGYRPTINWREISIRKRSVGDKQVLACIVVSGLVIIAVGILLTILGFLVIPSQCPFGWEEGWGSCYYMARHNTTWDRGLSYCKSQSASLLRLYSQEQTDFIKGKLVGESWLGLRRAAGASSDAWTKWESGGSLNYSSWAGGSQPSISSSTNSYCAILRVNGRWDVQGCEEVAFVICDYTPGNNPFMLVGPVVIGCGVVVLVLSVEVCLRRKEFIDKNPEVVLANDDDNDRQVDAGVINYGYGHFPGGDGTHQGEQSETVTVTPVPRKKLSWNTVTPSRNQQDPSTSQQTPTMSRSSLKNAAVSPTPSRTSTGTTKKAEVEVIVSPREGGPRVEVVAASPTPVAPSTDENTRSQEQLELLLSPKTLEH